ncbi:PucR family transcriptional regulator ligand-binding domain-containing protein, partial [Herbiconiux sp.]|uniref:PucR family transcriptional regulator ligand-binding domain-containing protein n=1 Tax=Herbiconiux sp. TaxID=1871186 RepID=UPI0025C0026C
MPVTLSELLATPALNLALLTEPAPTPAPVEAQADPELLWSHSSDLDDPSPFLEPGQLLLTTGRQFSEFHDADEYRDYVGRLQRAGVVALGFGTEVLRVTPPELVDACGRAGMPLLEVPYATPFIAVSRQIADRLAAEARQQLEWTLVSQEAVSR